MIKKFFIVLGNGFSIDLIDSLGKSSEIDVSNLFSKGGEVEWPGTNRNGFLSYKHCESLWTLGARTTMSQKDSINLIEDIITCINVYNLSKQNNIGKEKNQRDENNIFLKAYGELTTYLRYLFIYYNSKVTDEELFAVNVPLINFLFENLEKYDEVIIISYNYDIWLERLLKVRGIPFNIEGFETNETKIKILKPHGSISFSFNAKISQFSIRQLEFYDITQEPADFSIRYDFVGDYPIVNAIIPPAGDSNRAKMSWIKVLRESINEKIETASNGDYLLIYGLSYWHVDRLEIDDILTRIHPEINAVCINPYPPSNLDAVLTSLFKNYIHFKNAALLEVNNHG